MKTRVRVGLLVVGIVAAGALGAWALGFFRAPQNASPVQEEPPAGTVRFEDVAARAGITFRHFDPATPQHLIAETMGCGIGWIDYDADGWPDLFCVQAGPFPPATDPNQTHKLYRNNRNGTFTDVTDAVGLNKSGFCVGCAVGDYDNDGFDDLLVTSLGGVTLFHNEPNPAAPGSRRFADVTTIAQLAGTNPHYATSCAWGDLDGDGFLDLFVCNYVEIDHAKPMVCRDVEKGPFHSCPPTAYPVVSPRLYRNKGNGTFEDITTASGVAGAKRGAGLAVVIVDLDDDGRPDIYVANDLFVAQLFHNQTPPGGPVTLVERASLTGCALGPGGARMSGMCAEAGDVDGSGRPALFITNFQHEPNVLFRNQGKLRFDEIGGPSGLGAPSRSRLGFGACFLDANLDSHLDLAVANGHVYRSSQVLQSTPYAQEAQLFLGDGRGKFRDASQTAGADFLAPRVGRGAARCDFDNDGRPDLCLSAVGGPVALFRNTTETGNGWIGLELVGGGKSNRSAIGAVVTVESSGQSRTHFVVGGGSYLSASDRRLTVGLGAAVRADRVAVRWPSGLTQEFRELTGGRYYQLREAQPEAAPR